MASRASRGDLPEEEQKLVWATHARRRRTCSPRSSRAPLGGRSRAGTSWPPRTAPYSRSCNASWRSAWEPSPSRPPAATSTATTA